MSTGGTSAEDPTSNSDGMSPREINNLNESAQDLKIIYSNVRSELEKPADIGSIKLLNSVEIINLENPSDPTTSSLGIKLENSSIRAYAAAKNAGKTLSDIKDEVECVEVVETNVETSQMQISDVAKTTNLTESTFGLITQNLIVDKSLPILESEDNTQSKVQDDVMVLENNVMQIDEQIDNKTCSVELENSLPTSEKKETTSKVEKVNTSNSLSFLATEYASSDSDEEEKPPSPCEIITIVDDSAYKRQSNVQYRSKPANNDSESEDTESDSDDSTKSDSSDSDSESDSQVEDGPNVSKEQPIKAKKTKSEFEDLPPIEELKITVPEELCDRLGEVSGIVEQLVIVRPISGKPTLNLDSVLFLEKGHRVLGQVFDVFGQVADPHYCIRFNSEEHIKQSGIVVGMEVYYSPSTEHTSLVFLHELVKLKGIDVSGEDDMEPPEFSDDEEERAYNQLQKQKQREKPGAHERQDNVDAQGLPQKRQCYERQRNPWSSDWQSRNYNNPRSNRGFNQGPPRWNSESSQPPFQNPFHSPNSAYSPSQPPPNQYGQLNTFDTSQYQYNPYNNPYQQNNMYPPPNQGYAFGRSPSFRPNFNNYDSNLYRPNSYPPPPMSWAPPLPPPPPPPSM